MFKRPTSHNLQPTTSFAELRDIDSPAAARRAGAEFGREPHFAADLLRVRPWLPPLSGREALSAILDGEWTGFLALLGEDGPWVYAASVRDLQELARLYAAFRHDLQPPAEQAFWDRATAQAQAARQKWQEAHRQR